MSKKNRRKTLPQKDSFIKKGSFSVDDSKVYIIATIIMFHIVPLIFIPMGDVGKEMYAQAFYLSANVLFLSITGVIYGIKKGFNFKFPLIMSVLAILSPIIYGDFAAGMQFVGPFMLGVAYFIWSYVTTFLGGILKRVFNL